MKKLLFILLICTACQKEQCEEIITNVELGKTYTATSDGVVTVSNPDYCTVYISVNDSENKGTYATMQYFNVNIGDKYIVKQLAILYHTADSTWTEVCLNPVTATYKNICND